MKQLSDFEIKKAAALKTYRWAIRHKHSLAADAEIYATLPAVEQRIDEALALGTPLELNPGEIFDGV